MVAAHAERLPAPANRPLASVVINNYNYAHFLAQAIDSALAQTYQPLEVVVVDDGSTDDSRAVIASYGDRVVSVLKVNGGQGSALNAGFAASQGEVILFLDADDMLLPTAAERAVERLAEPGIANVCWPQWEIDADGQSLGAVIPSAPLVEGDLRERIIDEGPNACSNVPTSGNAWSRQFLERVLPMPEAEFRINGDCYLSTLASIYGLARAIQEPQGCYRVHGQNRYVLAAADEKSRRHLELYGRRCDILAQHFRAMKIDVDPSRWREGNRHYSHMRDVWAATQEISALAPEGARIIFLDDGKWGDGRSDTEAIRGRITIPFLECGGAYYGPPEDDATAIREFERIRRERAAGFAVIVWLAFWWLEHYSGFAAHLRSRFRCLLANERLIMYDLVANSDG